MNNDVVCGTQEGTSHRLEELGTGCNRVLTSASRSVALVFSGPLKIWRCTCVYIFVC